MVLVLMSKTQICALFAVELRLGRRIVWSGLLLKELRLLRVVRVIVWSIDIGSLIRRSIEVLSLLELLLEDLVALTSLVELSCVEFLQAFFLFQMLVECGEF